MEKELLERALSVIQKGEKRVLVYKSKKYYLFWKNGLCISCIRSGFKRYLAKKIIELLEDNEIIIFENSSIIQAKDLIRKINVAQPYFFKRENEIVYLGKTRPYSIFDIGKIPEDFFRNNSWIIPIKPKYFERIAIGIKKFEIRKNIPKLMREGDYLFLWVGKRGIKGFFKIKKIERVEKKKIDILLAGVSRKELEKYLRKQKEAYLIRIGKFKELKDYYKPQDLRIQNFILITHRPSLIEKILSLL